MVFYGMAAATAVVRRVPDNLHKVPLAGPNDLRALRQPRTTMMMPMMGENINEEQIEVVVCKTYMNLT